MGKLFRLEKLTLDGNPIRSPPPEILQKGTLFIIGYLRDIMPAGEEPPPREWLSIHPSPFGANNSYKPYDSIRVFCYNILAESYAMPERCSYCPVWALSWEYRKLRLLQELFYYDPDVLCLQEVEAEQYKVFFEPEMANRGYDGVFRPKSRARTMEDWRKVDGCVIFYKRDQFVVLKEYLIEYQSIALQKHELLTTNELKDNDQCGLNRLITKDNIGLALLLQPIPQNSRVPRGATPYYTGEEKVLVVNTHIHWDPEFSDVKLMQSQLLMERLMDINSRQAPEGETLPMIVCGDFNSIPGSAVYKLLTSGEVEGNHKDFHNYDYGAYSNDGLKHRILLKSAYAEVCGEPPFTNYTGDFVGVLDYILHTGEDVSPERILRPVDESIVLLHNGALPNPYMCSDHIPLVADLKLIKRKKQRVNHSVMQNLNL